MTESSRETHIGEYTVSLDGDDTLRIVSTGHVFTFPKEQTQALLQWLSVQSGEIVTPLVSTIGTSEGIPVPPIVEQNPLEAVQSIIDETIATARANYPASLSIENRDRFVDQLTRDRRIKPYISQGAVSPKQITLWVEQKLDTGEERIEEVPEKKRRWSLF